MASFFNDCLTLFDLKKAYKATAMKYHPDCGGDTSMMQQVNADYKKRVKFLKENESAKPSIRKRNNGVIEELRRVHEYEVQVNARIKAYNEQLRAEKAKAEATIAADPELANLIKMTGTEISYEFRLLNWIANTKFDYFQGRNFVNNLRATLNAKEQVIRWETWPE